MLTSLPTSLPPDCGELIRQLNACHERGLMNKFMGGCNGIKEELNMCLREEVRTL